MIYMDHELYVEDSAHNQSVDDLDDNISVDDLPVDIDLPEVRNVPQGVPRTLEDVHKHDGAFV